MNESFCSNVSKSCGGLVRGLISLDEYTHLLSTFILNFNVIYDALVMQSEI